MSERTGMASTNLKVKAALVFPFYWPAGSFPTNLAIILLLRGYYNYVNNERII